MYETVVLISVIIRQFFIANPFISLGMPLAWIINLLFESIFYMTTFRFVGLFYSRGAFPALGSAMYLGVYYGHTYLLSNLVSSSLSWWVVAIIIFLYVFFINILSEDI